MEVQEIKTLDDIVLAYKKGLLLVESKVSVKHSELWGIIEFRLSEDGKYTEVHIQGITTNIDKWFNCQTIINNVNIVQLQNYITKHNKNDKNKMEDYIDRMIQEHKELVVRINKLHDWVYGGAHEKVDAAEFANEAIQLKAMKVYEEALRARLFNAGVNYVDGQYLVSIDSVENETEDTTNNN